jgi:hypothetical protein
MTRRRLAWIAAAVAAGAVVVAGDLDLGAAPRLAGGGDEVVAGRDDGLRPGDEVATPRDEIATPRDEIVTGEGQERLPTPRPAPAAAPRRPGRPAPAGDTAPPPPPRSARAEAVARAYAEQSINWTAETLARQHRRLAALAAGPLREQNRAAAVDRVALERLRRDGAGQRGTVRAVETEPAYAGDVRAEVRTSERAFGRSLGPSRTRAAVYLARLARDARGWRVVGWSPRP